MERRGSWEGNWKARLFERVRLSGFETVTAFANARPAVPTVLLAKELAGEAGDINAVQVFTALLAEAEEKGDMAIRRFIRDIFARHLTRALPDGWPAVLDDDSRFAIADAVSGWITYTPDNYAERVKELSRIFMASPPPAGWRPSGPDDPRLLSLLPDE
jgi:hypothetical protein